jgi:hypothetical protein
MTAANIYLQWLKKSYEVHVNSTEIIKLLIYYDTVYEHVLPFTSVLLIYRLLRQVTKESYQK